MKTRKKQWLPLLFVSFLFLYGGGEALAEGHPEQVTMSWTEWTKLRTAWTAQEQDLQLLREKLETLRKNSTGQTETLQQLQWQLESSQDQLRKIRESLTNAQTSLTAARADLNQSRDSLEILKKEIEELERTQERIKRQRNIWAAVAAIAVGAAISQN